MQQRKLTVGSLKQQGTMKQTHENLIMRTQKKNVFSNSNIPTTSVNPRKASSRAVPSNSTIQLIQGQSSFSIVPKRGVTLLDAALMQKQAVTYKCKKGSCGKCAVQVLKGKNHLSESNAKETQKLTGLLDAGYRLACQACIVN